MRSTLLAIACAVVLVTFISMGMLGQQADVTDLRYTPEGKMLRPNHYREWVWLSSGLGMSYQPRTSASQNAGPFDNVFANASAYSSFLKTGTWPDKTVLALEIREAVSAASINQSGRTQGDLVALEVHVKDEGRFSDKWAFFAFGRSGESAAMLPTSATCYSCHEQHGVVDTTFVQFYPTLFKIATEKGTISRAK